MKYQTNFKNICKSLAVLIGITATWAAVAIYFGLPDWINAVFGVGIGIIAADWCVHRWPAWEFVE